jgi:CRISPR-associated protein Csm4
MTEIRFRTYYLTFKAGLHLSSGNGSYDRSKERLHSDQLHAALIAAAAKWSNTVSGEAPYHLSSAFPFFKGNERTLHFFPKPYLPFDEQQQAPGVAKKLKKVVWLEDVYYSALLRGERPHFNPDKHVQGSFLSSMEGLPDLMIRSERLRTRVGRNDGEDTKPYYVDDLRFAEGAGFYFLATSANEEGYRTLEQRLDMLADEGLGTDRSIGKGSFKFSKGELSLSVPDSATHCTNLSAYLPESKTELMELLGENHQYALIRRGGWLTSPPFMTYRRQEVHLMEAGGIFTLPSGHNAPLVTLGKVVDLCPTELKEHEAHHPVWRNGESIFLPLKPIEA